MRKIESLHELQYALRSDDAKIRAHLLPNEAVRLVITLPDAEPSCITLHHTPRSLQLLPASDVPDYQSLNALVLREHDMTLWDGTKVRYDELPPTPHKMGNVRYNQRLHRMITDWPAEFEELRITDPSEGSNSSATLIRTKGRTNRLSDLRQLTYYYVGGSRRSAEDIAEHNRLRGLAGTDAPDEEVDNEW